MIEELIKRWEQAEAVDEIRKGDEYIQWTRNNITVGISSRDFLSEHTSARLVKRREPKVPDDVLAIKAGIKDMPYLERRVFIRAAPGDEVWYDWEEDGYSLDELEDIRAMAEVGDFL